MSFIKPKIPKMKMNGDAYWLWFLGCFLITVGFVGSLIVPFITPDFALKEFLNREFRDMYFLLGGFLFIFGFLHQTNMEWFIPKGI